MRYRKKMDLACHYLSRAKVTTRYKMKYAQFASIARDVFNKFGWNYIEFYEQLTHVFLKLSDNKMRGHVRTIYNALDNSLTATDFVTRITKDPMVSHDYDILIQILYDIYEHKTNNTNKAYDSIVRTVGGEIVLCF